MTGNLRLRVGAGLAAAIVLLAVGILGALSMRSDDRRDGADVLAAAASSVDNLTPEPAPATPAPTSIPSPTTAAPALSPTTVPAAAAVVTAPVVTPPAAAGLPPAPAPPDGRAPAPVGGPATGPPPTVAAPQTFAIAPASGSGTTNVTASGTGCTGTAAGVALTVIDPAGVPFSGDGAAAAADGTWRVPFSIGGNAARGAYTVRATCRSGATALFEYPPQPFAVTS